MSTFNHTIVSPFRRVVAALSVALLLLLSVSAVAPTLHDQLHGDGGHAETSGVHSCAVVLFATGLALVAAIALPRPTSTDSREIFIRPGQLFFAAVRHLRPPPCGPPAR